MQAKNIPMHILCNGLVKKTDCVKKTDLCKEDRFCNPKDIKTTVFYLKEKPHFLITGYITFSNKGIKIRINTGFSA